MNKDKCKKCKGKGLIQIDTNIRGLKKCPYCNGTGNAQRTNKEREAIKSERK